MGPEYCRFRVQNGSFSSAVLYDVQYVRSCCVGLAYRLTAFDVFCRYNMQ